MKTSSSDSFCLNVRNRSDLPCVNGYSETRQRRCAQAVSGPAVLGESRKPTHVSDPRLKLQATPTRAFVPPNNAFRRRGPGRFIPTPQLSTVKVNTTRAPAQLVGPRVSLTQDSPITTNDIDVVSPADTEKHEAPADKTGSPAKTESTSSSVSGVPVDVDDDDIADVDVDVDVDAAAIGIAGSGVVDAVPIPAYVVSPPSVSAGIRGSRVLPEDRVAGSGSNNISARFMEPGKWNTLVQSKREDVMLRQSTSRRFKCRGCM